MVQKHAMRALQLYAAALQSLLLFVIGVTRKPEKTAFYLY